MPALWIGGWLLCAEDVRYDNTSMLADETAFERCRRAWHVLEQVVVNDDPSSIVAKSSDVAVRTILENRGCVFSSPFCPLSRR